MAACVSGEGLGSDGICCELGRVARVCLHGTVLL